MIFNAFYLLLALVLAPVAIYKRLRYGKYRESLSGAMGRRLGQLNAEAFREGCVWLHAVSVGETVAAKAMLPEVRRLFPGLPVVVSTTTETGQAHARRLFEGEVEAIVYYPLDFTWNVRRYHDFFRPRYFVLLEAELWPNFLRECGRRGCKVGLVNGRMSDRSHWRYMLVRRLLLPGLEAVRTFCMQTEQDGARMAALSGRPGDVHAVGNVKFDSLPRPLGEEERAKLSRELGLPPGTPAVVFGSTHPGEEELALRLLARLREAGRDETLILCPRHPERFDEVARLVGEARLPGGAAPALRRASRVESGRETAEGPAPDVLLLDRMGVLARAFGLGRIAILGGSFAPVGGHNVLEPAAHGIPVICGPHMHSQRELVRLMQEGEADLRAAPEELAGLVLRLLADEEERRRAGERARQAAEKNRGAARRCAELLERAFELPGSE